MGAEQLFESCAVDAEGGHLIGQWFRIMPLLQAMQSVDHLGAAGKPCAAGIRLEFAPA